MTWHNGSRAFGKMWKTGDSVGVACDLNKKSLSFSVNGQWSKPFGVAYQNIEVAGGTFVVLGVFGVLDLLLRLVVSLL